MNNRRRMTGVVTSNKMMKTVVVEVTRTYRHPMINAVRKTLLPSETISAANPLT